MIALRSIRQKLGAVALLTTLVSLILTVTLIVGYDLRNYHRALLNDMATQAELLAHMTAPALTFDDARLAAQNLSSLRIRPQVRAGAIYDARGKLFASYLAKGERRAPPGSPGSERISVGSDELEVVKLIVEGGEVLGSVFLRAEYTLSARLVDYLSIAGAVTVLAMLVAYLLVRQLGHIITAPVLAIADIAHEVVATRDYSRRAPRISDDEAGDLVDAFNAMLAEIEREAGKLGRARQEVMQLNEQLERRVQDRTMQLENANAELAVAMEAARDASQAKSTFLSSMSHELRTPLNAILGFAQIMASDALPSTAQQKKDFAGHILKSGRHLLTLINEMLDLAKVESGTVTLSMEPVGVDAVLSECRSMVEPIANSRQVRLLFPEASPELVAADRTRLKQVLLNLLSNAIKYNRERGVVVVSCHRGAQGAVRIAIQDTGNGLAPEQIDKLFEPFNRLGQEYGEEEGSGIGLVLTRRLVEMMKGTIGVTSNVGVGTVFWIELEGVQPGLRQAAVEAIPESDLGGAQHQHGLRTVLYVEDNPVNLKLVQEFVGFRKDMRLLSAADGLAGVELARSALPDVILMDLNLPQVGGLEALRMLRVDSRTMHIPVIALTASAMTADVESGLASGFFRYLTKPINIAELTLALDAAFAKAAQAHAASTPT
jgi:signal transduction histidine kinase/CheY-like chemotaxis protein